MNQQPTKQNLRHKFTIPVFPHVKKFVQKEYGKTATIKAEEYKSVGKMVTLALREKSMSKEHNGQYRDRLTENITIVLTTKQAKLSPKLATLMRINIDIDALFKEHLIAWIHSLGEAGIVPYSACKIFMTYYDLDEAEYKLTSLHQYWIRYQQNQPNDVGK